MNSFYEELAAKAKLKIKQIQAAEKAKQVVLRQPSVDAQGYWTQLKQSLKQGMDSFNEAFGERVVFCPQLELLPPSGGGNSVTISVEVAGRRHGEQSLIFDPVSNKINWSQKPSIIRIESGMLADLSSEKLTPSELAQRVIAAVIPK